MKKKKYILEIVVSEEELESYNKEEYDEEFDLEREMERDEDLRKFIEVWNRYH